MSTEPGDDRPVGRRSALADGLAPPGVAAPSSVLIPDDEVVPQAARSARQRPTIFTEPRRLLVLVGLITLVGFLLRLPSFHDSLATDEISTYYIVVGNSLGRVLQLVNSDQELTPPLFFILAWATKGLLASQSESIRLVSLATGTAAIPLTFVLGVRTVGRRAALVGASCVALSPFMIFYSSEARTFMLVLFLALVSTLALIRALDTGRVLWWVVYAVCTSAAAYSHYSVAFYLVVQLGWALWTQPRAWRPLVVTNMAAVLTYIPWLGGLRADLHAPNLTSAIFPVTFANVVGSHEVFWIGHPLIPPHVLPGTAAIVLAAAGLLIGLVGVVLRRRGDRPWWRLAPRTALVVALTAGPAALIVVYSIVRVDVLGGPNVIASWPPMALLIGALVTGPPKPVRAAAVLLTVVAFAIGGLRMLSPSAQRADVGAVVAYLDRHGAPGDPVVDASLTAKPLTELDVALANAGQSDRYRVIRLGSPPLSEVLPYFTGPNPQPLQFFLPVAAPRTIAQQAVAEARRGRLFLVTLEASPSAYAVYSHAAAAVVPFIGSLPKGYRQVAYRSFPADGGALSEVVFEFRYTTSGH